MCEIENRGEVTLWLELNFTHLLKQKIRMKPKCRLLNLRDGGSEHLIVFNSVKFIKSRGVLRGAPAYAFAPHPETARLHVCSHNLDDFRFT